MWQVAPRFERDGRPNGLLRLAIRIARNLAVSEVRRTKARPVEAISRIARRGRASDAGSAAAPRDRRVPRQAAPRSRARRSTRGSRAPAATTTPTSPRRSACGSTRSCRTSRARASCSPSASASAGIAVEELRMNEDELVEQVAGAHRPPVARRRAALPPGVARPRRRRPRARVRARARAAAARGRARSRRPVDDGARGARADLRVRCRGEALVTNRQGLHARRRPGRDVADRRRPRVEGGSAHRLLRHRRRAQRARSACASRRSPRRPRART